MVCKVGSESLGAWGKKMGKESGCDSQVFGFMLHSVGILRVAGLDEERRA